jgi:predicted SAM-dependent methyltransferase
MRTLLKKLFTHLQNTYIALKTVRYNLASKKIISEYFNNHAIKKLHIGCGQQPLTGWLNSDYYPTNPDILHLDATVRFPFDDNSFDYVFSEHMIEHITYLDGLKMLKESRRILKPNGKIRISTPNLQFLIDLYSNSKTETQKNYIQWVSDNIIKNGELGAPEFMNELKKGAINESIIINRYVRKWGHQFIYDKQTLCHSLELSGFVNVTSHKINISDDPSFRDLESEGRMPAGFLQLETLTLEAIKP